MGFRMGPKSSDRCPYKKKAKVDLRLRHTEEKAREDRGRDRRGAATVSGTPAATRSWKRPRRVLPQA